jgi:2-amino-4-hydroxy-6-hydroxymethyldihydropteridine diphosphokinase
MQHVSVYAIGLGSNIEPRLDYLRSALHQLSKFGAILAQSSWHETKPEGFESPDLFLNGVAMLETHLSPDELWVEMARIELDLGRVRTSLGPRSRTLDLDLILWSKGFWASDDVILPHPRMHLREFVLAPLAEIASEWVHPELHRSVGELLKSQGHEV